MYAVFISTYTQHNIKKLRILKNNKIDNINAKKKCSWFDCDSPATEECDYCGRKYCMEHSVRHELARHGNKT
jgi:hypothetical protein